MAWPTSKPSSNAFDSADDSISASRGELKTMSDAVNDIVDFVDTTGIVNGDVLVYDSTSGTIKPGTNYQLLNINAGDNITIDQDSGGGITINSEGGAGIFPTTTVDTVAGTGTVGVNLVNNSTTIYRAIGGSATTINIECSAVADGINKNMMVVIDNQTSPSSNVSFQFFYNGTAFTGTTTLVSSGQAQLNNLVCIFDPDDSAGRVAIDIISSIATQFYS